MDGFERGERGFGHGWDDISLGSPFNGWIRAVDEREIAGTVDAINTKHTSERVRKRHTTMGWLAVQQMHNKQTVEE
jgi:hypothetical protein